MKISLKLTIVISLITFVIAILLGGIGEQQLANSKVASANKESKMNKAKHKLIFTKAQHPNSHGKYVFLNASQNTNGNTAQMAQKLLRGKHYQQINLAEYHIPQIGQGEGDYPKVFARLRAAKVLVIGTPVYWSNMSGYLKTFIDHLEINEDLKGADLYLIVQGADSQQEAAIQSSYGSWQRIARRFGLNFVGIASNDSEINSLQRQLTGK
ncbi:flavodoxin family protein [Lactobacillus sp. DCY120]|uniref:Flavodoxin family protein n=1 Tax=Bombilactobacillus apium TaxID=2675299 RepID=A0A850R0W7_9LACO|nr:NAD(P)H-dependent oxidoreductase [Bombilactobacillus apium]NVY96000.1 flavodoxin family protein [Bombilactobacillus apium]